MSLEDMLKFVEAKESGKRSASRLLDPPSVSAASSTYRRSKQREIKGKQPDTRDRTPVICSYCGGKGHGRRAPIHTRRNECPAYDHTCSHCSKKHHFEGVCLSKDNPNPPRNSTVVSACGQEAATLDELCNVRDIHHWNTTRPITLDHHLYNNMSDRWTRRTSRPQPYIRLTHSANAEDYTDLGFKLRASTKSLTSSVMADTGCQSCLAGIGVIGRLGLTRADLIPVTMKMNAADEKGINILGAAILVFSGIGKPGHSLETRQITYITDCSDRISRCVHPARHDIRSIPDCGGNPSELRNPATKRPWSPQQRHHCPVRLPHKSTTTTPATEAAIPCDRGKQRETANISG